MNGLLYYMLGRNGNGAGGSSVAFKNTDATKRPTVVDLTNWVPFKAASNYPDQGVLTKNSIPGMMFYAGANAGATGQNIMAWHKLESVICPQKIYAVGNSAFHACEYLVYDSSKFSLEDVEVIGPSAFRYCSSFNAHDLSLPNVQRIYSSAFAGASASDKAIVTGEVTLGSEGMPVLSIGANVFQYQSDITKITVYTTDGAELQNQPWGAENAVIEYLNA